ncbi:MAG: hypothetical protein ACR2KA_09625 [Opitutales bacterium]
MRFFPRISLCLLSAAWLGLGTASAIDLDGLVKNSPFGGTGAPAGPGVAPSTLEFRGMYKDGGVNYYSIYNTQTKQSSWVAEGEAPSANVPVVVKGFDAVNETLMVDNGGQPQKMELHQAVVIAYKGPSPAQLAAVSTAVAPGAPGAPAPGGTAAALTPEQIEAFRQSMRDRFGKRGANADGSADPNAAPRQRGNADAAATTGKASKSSKNR